MSYFVRVVSKAGDTISDESFLGRDAAMRVFRGLQKDLYGGVYAAQKGAKVLLEKTGRAGKQVVIKAYEIPRDMLDELG